MEEMCQNDLENPKDYTHKHRAHILCHKFSLTDQLGLRFKKLMKYVNSDSNSLVKLVHENSIYFNGIIGRNRQMLAKRWNCNAAELHFKPVKRYEQHIAEELIAIRDNELLLPGFEFFEIEQLILLSLS